MLKIALICGGPSEERGISLNSARSFLDHTHSWEIELHLLYRNPTGHFYRLSAAQLYSNTPADFDFKLAQEAAPLGENELISYLQEVDLVFPLIHGAYGEDGTLQRWLETHQIPFAGSSSGACKNGFNKNRAQKILAAHHFATLPSLLLEKKMAPIEPFWKEKGLKKGIVKPTESGSSIGVCLVDSPQAASDAATALLERGFSETVLEPFCEDAEFTICVLQSPNGPVALLPLEIDYGKKGIFDYRKKYLPTDQTRYYCPPRFSAAIIEKIRQEAERLFTVFSLSDFARIDGWVSLEGQIRFADLNPISGMEQNSFLFQQAAKIGMTHADLVGYILTSALSRASKPLPKRRSLEKKNRRPVYILMGGETSEREVSLMSGTNVWLKLLDEESYEPTPYLLGTNQQIWKLPYSFALHHTVEEIEEQCQTAEQHIKQLKLWVNQIREELGLSPLNSIEKPESMSLNQFIKRAKTAKAFVFLALHGGIGEDGTLQQQLEENKIPFNGSSSSASALCMDKRRTAERIGQLNDPHVLPIPQISFDVDSLSNFEAVQNLWQQAIAQWKTGDCIVKPQRDGCSTGVVRIRSVQELFCYIECIQKRVRQAPIGTFFEQTSAIEMPITAQPFLLEPFIATDKMELAGTKLNHRIVSGWLEMTIGVLESSGKYCALNPSITVAQNHVLSLEEKFQGGTGINITPPPETILSTQARNLVQKGACQAAAALEIGGYARLDLFVECATGVIRIIEANTLPALTPSTVLYHQALSASPAVTPKSLIKKIIEN